jgi:hypothetical protein
MIAGTKADTVMLLLKKNLSNAIKFRDYLDMAANMGLIKNVFQCYAGYRPILIQFSLK